MQTQTFIIKEHKESKHLEFFFVCFLQKKKKKRKEKHVWPQCLSVPFISGQENKGILFVAVQDVNLFWLVASL